MNNSRRSFIKRLVYAGGVMALPPMSPAVFAQSSYSGKLLISVQFVGAWDVSSFCDPKENTPGEPIINSWALTDEPIQIGNIAYAPYANNKSFFEAHFQKILVVNGVDFQTNSHSTGEIHSWSGRTATGFPSLSALMAAVKAPELPMAHLNFGGFSNSEGIVSSTRMGAPHIIRNIVFPNQEFGHSFIAESDWRRIRQNQLESLGRLVGETNLVAGDRKNRELYMDAILKSESMQEFGNLIPPDNEIQHPKRTYLNYTSTLHQQIQMTLTAFKAGVSVSADLSDGGYDTHAFHDRNHEALLSNGMDAINYLWDLAEDLGLADRLVVVLGSDFSRTPYYNSGDGKDHWPIGSYIVMEKNTNFTNRVVGETDGGQNAFKINPTTLQRDDREGVLILPKHFHGALRRYLNIADNSIARLFPYNTTEDFKFFDAA